MDRGKFEKEISRFIESGYEVLKVYDDGTVGFYMDPTSESEDEHFGRIKVVTTVTMAELEEYRVKYGMSWEEVPEFFANDYANEIEVD